MCLRRLTFGGLNGKSPSRIPRGGILAALLGNIEGSRGAYRPGLIGLGVNDDSAYCQLCWVSIKMKGDDGVRLTRVMCNECSGGEHNSGSLLIAGN